MTRDNQTLIAIRLDPDLLRALDLKREKKRQSRSQFIRDAIYEAVADTGISKDTAYPQDRVGTAKGGRPKGGRKIEAVPGTGKPKKKVSERKEAG